MSELEQSRHSPNPNQSRSPLLPDPELRPKRRWVPSLVWLIPIVAAVIALSLLVHTLAERGPEITVTFRTADGLVPGKTPVRYKAVDIGLVKSLRLAADQSHVVATIGLTSDAQSFANKGTRFWVVRPRVAVSGISGLETLLSGTYIGVDPAKSSERRRSFTGLEAPPAVTADASGKQFVLRASDLGSLDIGSPVYYRRVQVGQVVGYQLNPNGRDLSIRVFVNKPYDKFVTADTRFWHASGIDIKLDSGGFKLNTQSLATVVLGGVAFQARDDSKVTAAAEENTQFVLAGDQATAFKATDELAPTLAVLNFDQSVRGLVPGAPVDFRGIVVGQVKSVGIEFRRDKKAFRIPVVVELYPSRIGLDANDLADKRYGAEIAEAMNKRGLRAQLRTGNLLTGQLFVTFDFFPGSPPAKLNLDSALPELPTIPGSFDELQTKLGNIVSKLDKVPFDQIGDELQATMSSLNKMLVHADKLTNQLNGDVVPQVSAALQDARKTLQAASSTLDSGAPMQQDARRMMQELTRTAISLRTLTDYLESHPEAVVRGKSAQETP